MGKGTVLIFISMFAMFSYSQDREYEAYNYCLGCIDELTILERQNANLKAQVVQRGIAMDTQFDVSESYKLLLDRANEYIKELLNKKPKFKDLGFWSKLWAWSRALILGAAIGYGVALASG